MKNKVLIITGMHRSGTSVISQWLNKCGLHIGNSLLGPSAGNEDGHFEDQDFVHVHEEILKQLFLPHTGLTPHSLPVFSNEQKEKIRLLINKKNSQQLKWGWKDPRTCLFLPVYKEVLPSAYYLVIVRDPVASVSSLINRRYLWLKHKNSKGLYRKWRWKKTKNKVKEELFSKYSEYYLKVWIEYNKRIWEHICSIPENSFLVVSYGSLHVSDENIFQHISANWDFTLSYVDFKSIFKEQLLTLPADIDHYVNNKLLLEEATNLFLKLRQKEKTVKKEEGEAIEA